MFNFATSFRPIYVAIALVCIIGGCEREKMDGANKPNIILILADDLGYGDLSVYNPQSKILTPNIDRLAEMGIRFTDAHASGSWCVPSRYGLLTGRYPMRTSMNWKSESIINTDQITLATLLKSNGYQTGMVGKWHQGFENMDSWQENGYNTTLQGGPTDHGFEYYYGIPASLDIPPYFYIKNDQAVQSPTATIEASLSKKTTTAIQGPFWRAGKIAPGFKHSEVLPRLTNKALAFIEQSRKHKSNQPFFLYYALTAPHTPWLPSDHFKGSSKAGSYGDFVIQTDDAVGQIMEKLDQLGIKKNTLILFASDNGPVWFTPDEERYQHDATHPLKGMKIDAWEGGHRIPFIARWPNKIKPGNTSDALVGFTDMLATFAALAGDTLSKNTGMDSYNLLPIFYGKQPSVRNTLVVESNVIRKGPWKLIMGSGMGGLQRHYAPMQTTDTAKTPGELYNLGEDITERNNLYREYPGVVKELEQLLKQIRNRSVSDVMHD